MCIVGMTFSHKIKLFCDFTTHTWIILIETIGVGEWCGRYLYMCNSLKTSHSKGNKFQHWLQLIVTAACHIIEQLNVMFIISFWFLFYFCVFPFLPPWVWVCVFSNVYTIWLQIPDSSRFLVGQYVTIHDDVIRSVTIFKVWFCTSAILFDIE